MAVTEEQQFPQALAGLYGGSGFMNPTCQTPVKGTRAESRQRAEQCVNSGQFKSCTVAERPYHTAGLACCEIDIRIGTVLVEVIQTASFNHRERHW